MITQSGRHHPFSVIHSSLAVNTNYYKHKETITPFKWINKATQLFIKFVWNGITNCLTVSQLVSLWRVWNVSISSLMVYGCSCLYMWHVLIRFVVRKCSVAARSCAFCKVFGKFALLTVYFLNTVWYVPIKITVKLQWHFIYWLLESNSLNWQMIHRFLSLPVLGIALVCSTMPRCSAVQILTESNTG